MHQVSLLPEMGELFRTVFADMDAARTRVAVESYIVREDALGRRLGEHLARAAARRVEARLLFDPLGSWHTSNAFFERLHRAGVVARSYGRLSSLVGRLRPRARNHSRIILTDRAAYTGGFGWGYEWLPVEEGGRGWRDVACRVTGPVVEDFAALFDQRWREARDRRACDDYDTGDRYPDVRLVSDTPVRESLVMGSYIEAFDRARRRIWLANAYFFPPRTFLDSLKRAARRGVDVRIIVPGRSDLAIIARSARAEYLDWMHAGIRVFEHQGVMMHSKYVVVDDLWAAVGTLNANATSLSFAIELALIAYQRSFVARAAAELERDMRLSRRVTDEVVRRRPFIVRELDHLAHAAFSTLDALVGRPRRRPAHAMAKAAGAAAPLRVVRP